MRQRTRIRRSLFLLRTAQLELARGTAAALVTEGEWKAHGKRAGRLILEAIREAQHGHVFSFAPPIRPQAGAQQLGGGSVDGMAALEIGCSNAVG